MSDHADQPWKHGKVVNKSSVPVWCLYDVGTDENKVILARVLKPGRKSPKGIDVDAVGAKGAGNTISGYDGWWKVPGIVTATVANNIFSDGVRVMGNPPGLLTKTKESDWGIPAGNIGYSEFPDDWGEKI